MTADGPTPTQGPPGGPGRHTADPPDEPVPLGQRLYDSPFILLVAGILIMFICFTGWGLWEILSLPQAPLP
ncbi:MAG: hypothetical protein RJQ04_03065 [Longimicrobiales bacterium]